MNKMNPDKQQIAIAEACGWKWMRRMTEVGEPAGYNNSSVWLFSPGHLEGIDCQTVPVGRFERCDKPEKHNGFAYNAPNYLTDLNAMHEAEKVLTDTWRNIGSQRSVFTSHLLVMTGGYYTVGFWPSIHATAAQRAEAFLKTIEKWENT